MLTCAPAASSILAVEHAAVLAASKMALLIADAHTRCLQYMCTYILFCVLLQYQLNTTLPKYQLQLSGAGYANMNNTAESLVINADTNASFVGSGKFSDVVLNWASSGASIVSQASQVRFIAECLVTG